jgi:NAD(P)-dependent dehydrogenase (short-subunit alcohol dehydrogenase family)
MADNHGGKIYPVKCDMGDMSSIADMFQWIESHAELGRVDSCICNAGMAIPKNLSDLTPDEMRQMMDVNVTSASYCTQLSVNLMMKNGVDDGSIIFISRYLSLGNPKRALKNWGGQQCMYSLPTISP